MIDMLVENPKLSSIINLLRLIDRLPRAFIEEIEIAVNMNAVDLLLLELKITLAGIDEYFSDGSEIEFSPDIEELVKSGLRALVMLFKQLGFSSLQYRMYSISDHVDDCYRSIQ